MQGVIALKIAISTPSEEEMHDFLCYEALCALCTPFVRGTGHRHSAQTLAQIATYQMLYAIATDQM